VDTTVLGQRCAAAAGCLVLHESATDPLPTVALPAAGELLVVVGPEGGITDSELATLTAAGGRPVRLGSGILRSSSAGIVALSAINALSQRWS
jgi:16S rRNA (uracil1498-N3)-methyltransferase